MEQMFTADTAAAISRARRHSVGDLLHRTARRTPDKLAVVSGDLRVTYAEFDTAVNRAANALAARGFAKGDRLALLSHNCWQYAVLVYATARLGVVLVPVNFMLTAQEVGYILEHSGASGVVAEDALVPTAQAAIGDRPVTVRAAIGSAPEGWENVDDWWRTGPAAEPDVPVADDDPLRLMYTSGTESRPKGVMLSSRSLISQYVSCAIDGEMSGDDIDRARVRAVRSHVRVPVQQRLARHPHTAEPQAPVVDAVQPGLRTTVLDPHPGHRPARLVADRHQERVHTVRPVADDELREHHRHPPVAGRVADVVLACLVVGGVDREPVVGERGRGAQVLDVRTVAGLGHREAARHVERHDAGQIALVVAPGAEHLHRATEQSPLDTGLDHQRQVAVAEQLERHHRAADVALAAVRAVEPEPRVSARHQLTQLLEHLRAVRLAVEVVGVGELRRGHPVPQPPAQLGPASIEDGRERAGIHLFGHGSSIPRHGTGHTFSA
jgi:hypothetical protein